MTIKNLSDYEVFDFYFNKSQNKKDKTDIEHQLFDRYKPLVYKMKGNFNNRLQKIPYVPWELKEHLLNYENDIYHRFIMAVAAVRWDKIKPTWTFHYQFWGYLNTYNRDVIHNFIKNNNSVSYEEIISSEDAAYKKDLAKIEAESSSNPEEDYLKKEESTVLRTAINNSLKKFNNVQTNIWNLKANNVGIKVDSICSSCNISQKEYRTAMKNMKKIMTAEIEKLNY